MRLIGRFSDEVASCEAAVREILARVRQEGDSAVLEYCRRFDAPDMTAAELSTVQVAGLPKNAALEIEAILAY